MGKKSLSKLYSTYSNPGYPSNGSSYYGNGLVMEKNNHANEVNSTYKRAIFSMFTKECCLDRNLETFEL